MKPFKIRFKTLQMLKIFAGASMLIILSLIFIFAGFIQDPEGELGKKIFLIALQIFGGFSLLFFVPLVLYLFFSIITRRPGFIISEKGITDKSQLYAAGFMKWEDIEKMTIGDKHTVTFLSIDLHNPNLILDRAGFIKRLFLKSSEFLSSNQVQVDLSRLAITADELVKQLSLYSRGKFNEETITETKVEEWNI